MDVTRDDCVSDWPINRLKDFLKERGVICGSASKPELVQRVIQCQIARLPTQDANECVDITIHNKLLVDNGLVRLPNPDNLSDWENGFSSIPDITSGCVNEYFTRINSGIGVETNGGQSIQLGKGLALSGHVANVQYHGITPRIGYCFVKSNVARQVHYKEDPYTVWAILDKESGKPHTAYCNCPGGYVKLLS